MRAARRKRRPVRSTRSSNSSLRRAAAPSSSRSTRICGAWPSSSSVSALSAARDVVLLRLVLERARQDVEGQHLGEGNQQENSAGCGKDRQRGNRLGHVDQLRAHFASLVRGELLATRRPGEQDGKLARLADLAKQPLEILLQGVLHRLDQLFAHCPGARRNFVEIYDGAVLGEELGHFHFNPVELLGGHLQPGGELADELHLARRSASVHQRREDRLLEDESAQLAAFQLRRQIFDRGGSLEEPLQSALELGALAESKLQ